MEVAPVVLGDGGVGVDGGDVGDVADGAGAVDPAVPLGDVTDLWGGVDAGGLSNWTYAGGLAAAYFTGRRAGASAARHGASLAI